MNAMLTCEIQGAVALVTINRPDAANALSAGVRAELRAIVDGLSCSQAVCAVVLTSAGRKVFAAGSDIQDMVEMTAAESVALSESIRQLNGALSELPQPVICAVNGWCLGGGWSWPWPAISAWRRRPRALAFPRPSWASCPAVAACPG